MYKTQIYQSIQDYLTNILKIEENEFEVLSSTIINKNINNYQSMEEYWDNYSHIIFNLKDRCKYIVENGICKKI